MSASGLGGRSLKPYLFILPYGVSFLTFVAAPIIISAALALMRFDLTSRQHATFVGFGNFIDLFKDAYFLQAAGVSCTFALMMVPA